MTEKLELYHCEICGNIVEVVENGAGQLVCCGQNMILLEPKTIDEGAEKHVPVIENKRRVKVGTIPHPMIDEHYIMFIEAINGDKLYRQYLHTNETPEIQTDFDINYAREYCNIHGLWRNND